MKKYIILSVLLVIGMGLNAQRTTTGSRTAKTTSTSKSADDEKKSSPAKTETRTRETSKPSSTVETKKESTQRPTVTERKSEPVRNESRNRETPAVRTIDNTRKVETKERETPASTRPVSNTREADQKPTRTSSSGNQEPERRTSGTVSGNRTTGGRTSGTPGYDNGSRTAGNTRETNSERSREYTPRTDQESAGRRQAYRTPERPRTARTVNHSTTFVHQPIEYRRNYYPYAEPRRVDIIWDVHMYNEYRYIYPQYDYWYYPFGYSIQTVSAYDADRYIGEIARIYGRVSDVWYERETDEYTLYFGEPYPYQDFSVILSGRQARRFSRHPERYFINRNIAVTGLVSLWEERPEMVVRKRSQMEIYF